MMCSIVQNTLVALLGVGLSIVAICFFLPFGLSLYKILPNSGWERTAGLAAYVMGTALALVSFTFAFGFSWGLADLVRFNASASTDLNGVATMGMRAFVFGDDLATALIGIGHLFFGLKGLREGSLPKWLSWWGIIAGVLVTMVLLRYFFPVFSVAQIGYPLVILWFVLTGIQLWKSGKA